ncbi:MAG: metallophosphoesterase family protein [Bacilli bacterium]|nr:metallophosphoesterase family protein [Bacilli bacterium]
MIYYISDIHFNDQRIFDKCNRPFRDLNDFKEAMIKNWNAKVGEQDDIYVLGDIAEDSDSSSLEVFRLLNGKKHLIVGNHDTNLLEAIKESAIFESIDYISLINDSGRKVCICHYPLMDWMEFNRNGMLVYGHIHNKTASNGAAYAQIKDYYKDKPAYNCGVDVTGYKPVTLDEMIELKEANKDEPYIN